jgi:DNA-directed RNA polymerase specialized sigma subunit
VLVQLTGEELKLLRENSKAVRIYKTHSDQAIERQEESLGIGFETADEIAKNVGIPKESLSRASTGIDHVLLNGTRFLSRNLSDVSKANR